MQCKEVEAVLELEGLGPLPEAAQTHLAGCKSCQYLLQDFTKIAAAAHELPAEVEPPARIWISLRAQLEAEGLIQTPIVVAEHRASWWQSLKELFQNRGLATAAAGVLIVASAVYQLQTPTKPPAATRDLFADTALALHQQEQDISNMQLASSSAVDTSLRQNLRTVDDFIAECELRLKQEPHDELAREYLSRAYEQKAELLSAMTEHSGSLH